MVPSHPTHINLFQEKCVPVHITLFDNIHLANKHACIVHLKASCNYDEAKIQADLYGRWGQFSWSFFSHLLDKDRIMVADWDGIPTWADGYDDVNLWMRLDWGTRTPRSLLLAYRTPVLTWRKGKRIGAGSLVLVDEVYTCLIGPDGTRQWNEADRELTSSKLANAAKELRWRNGISIERIPQRHRVADASPALWQYPRANALQAGRQWRVGWKLLETRSIQVCTPPPRWRASGPRCPG